MILSNRAKFILTAYIAVIVTVSLYLQIKVGVTP